MRRWRLAARAVETPTKRYTASFESSALKDAVALVKTRWSRVLRHLGPRRLSVRRRCQQPKAH
eukprot:532918-Lingulodinium_polyedra.AAC.1